MDGAMQGSYATALLKQQQLPESFHFYFKQKQQLSNTQELHQLHGLVR
ncbi:MAG TPA: glycosyl transferase, partial [Acinetobacter nosocomialis]|nr:glycosyl transferase [Acinetobacter nosocomialis]